MDEVHRAADNLFTEVDHLERVLGRWDDPDDLSPEAVMLALSVAKRVRDDSTLLVRALARLRDTLQP